MKKILGMFLAVSIVLSGIGAFAETASPAPTETPQVTVEPTVSPGTTIEPTETAATTPAVSRLLAGRLEQTSLGRRMNMCGKTLSTLWAFGKTYPSKSRGSIRIWMSRARMQRSRRNNNQFKKKGISLLLWRLV